MDSSTTTKFSLRKYGYYIYIPVIIIFVYCIYCCFYLVPKQTTFIILRHAEKTGNGLNDPLSAKGFQRADSLAYALGDVEIEAIYATQYLRTQQTITPTATAHGIAIEQYNVSTDQADIDAFIDQLFIDYKGQSIVIVGHSNTIHLMVNSIRDNDLQNQINSGSFDLLFVVTATGKGNAKLLPLKYGFQTP